MRLSIPLFCILSASAVSAQQVQPTFLPDAPSATLSSTTGPSSSSDFAPVEDFSLYPAGYGPQQSAAEIARQSDTGNKPKPNVQLDANGNPIPLNRQQPKRILGFMPNFRSVSAGAAVHPPGWKYNFHIATRQAFDYSSFIFLGITSISAEGIDSHPALRKGIHGAYSYTWRGLIDKTDGTYLGAWLLPSLLHQDNRYYPLGDGHRVVTRVGYVISRQAVTRTYGGHQTFNISGLGAKVLTQYISRLYYPKGTSDFSVLATKFGYSAARDIGFSSIREFYPDIAAHYVRKHRAKVLAEENRRLQTLQPKQP